MHDLISERLSDLLGKSPHLNFVNFRHSSYCDYRLEQLKRMSITMMRKQKQIVLLPIIKTFAVRAQDNLE